MCSKCQDILIGFSIPHPVSACPLAKASYCSLCCCYGHLTECCPDDDAQQSRTIQFVEQLVPYALLQQYNITSLTPLHQAEAQKRARFEPVLEVEETDRAIRQILMNYSIQPSGKMKENRRLLKQLSEELGRKLVYLKPN
jgi:hypothetical protein